MSPSKVTGRVLFQYSERALSRKARPIRSFALAPIGERLSEIPIVLVGLAWMLLGYSELVAKGVMAQAPARVR